MGTTFKSIIAALVLVGASSASAQVNVPATVSALRIANTITGGFMPTTDPLFAQMVTRAAAGDLVGAANIASNSKYFASYLARRLALQMQSPAMDSGPITDSDATAFVIAHFVGGGGTKASISTLFSEDATYNVSINGAAPIKAASLTEAQKSTLDWGASLVRVAGQQVRTPAAAVSVTTTLPIKHVGGYYTLSDRINDNSFAMYGGTAGTNLRYIEGIWMTSTGFQLVDVQSVNAPAQVVPRFIPEKDPNFFKGQGQAACISCHGGGMPSVTKGYAAVADVFDFDAAKGLVYIATPTQQTKKSLGSDRAKRAQNEACDLVRTPAADCNPDSVGVDVNNGWDVGAVWSTSGVLDAMGWTGPMTGQGLNELGKAIGQSRAVYEYMTKRVIAEVCPLGAFKTSEVKKIAALANPYATPAGTDDIRTIVNNVAVHASCM